MAILHVETSATMLEREHGMNPNTLDKVPNDTLDPCIPVVVLIGVDCVIEDVIHGLCLLNLEEFQEVELWADVLPPNLISV